MSKSMSRRAFLRASTMTLGATLGAHVLAACAPRAATPASSEPTVNEPAVPTVVAGSQEKIQLRYSHWGNEDEKASTKATLDAFMKQNPNIVVEQMYIPESGDPYVQKMTAMAASNTLPDAALFPDPHTLDWAIRDQFLDLSDIFTGEHEKVDAIQYRTPDGKLVAASAAQEIALIFYNKDLFDEAGMAYPPAKADEAWTWDEFLDIAKQLTVDTQGRPASDPGFDPENVDRFGCKMGTGDFAILPFVRSNGGDFFAEDWLSLTIDQPEVYEALQQMADLRTVHRAAPAFGLTGGVGSMSTDTALLSRKVAMVQDGQWALETLNRVRREEGLNFGIGVLPRFKDPVTVATGGPIVAFKATKHPAEAAKLVSFIMDPHSTPEYITGGLWMPNEKRWYTDEELISKWIDNENHPPEYRTAVLEYSFHVTRPLPIFRIPGWTGMFQILNAALEQAWLGDATVEEAIQGVLPQVQDYYEKNILSLMS